MDLNQSMKMMAAIGWLGGFGLLAGCGGDSGTSTPPTASPVSSAENVSNPPAMVSQPTQTDEKNDESAAGKERATYGGEEIADQSGGGFPGSGSGQGWQGSDDGSNVPFGSDGGLGFGGGGGSRISGAAGPGSSTAGSAPGAGSGPPSAPAGGPLGGGQPGGLGFGASDGLEGLGGNATSGLGGQGRGFQGAEGFNGLNANGTNVAVGLVQQFCVSCHSVNSPNGPKGDVRLDSLTEDVESAKESWRAVLRVVEEGTMPPAQAIQPDHTQRSKLVELIRQKLGADNEASYFHQAEMAYQQGEHLQSLKLYYAHALTVDDDQAGEQLSHIKLYRPKVAKPDDLVAANESAATIKPRLTTGLKLAVGIMLEAPAQVTDVKPIGTRQGQGGSLGGGDFSAPGGIGQGGLGGEAANSSSKLTAFEDLTGDYGKSLVKAFESRRSEGRYGTLFASLSSRPSTTGMPRDPATAPGLPGAGLGFDGADGLGNSGGNGLDGSSGIGAPGMAGPGQSGPGPGGPGIGGPGIGGPGIGGPGLSGPGIGGAAPGGAGPGGTAPGGAAPGGAAGGMGLGGMGSGGMGTDGAAHTLPGQPLANGLTYLGKGTTTELLAKATEMGADGLFIFDIKAAKNNRTNTVITDTRLRFMLASGKVVATAPKTLKNTEIEKALAQNKDSDDVQKQVDHLFSRLDDILVVEDVPQMSEAAALKHLHGQVHSEEDSLQIMAQARLFHSKGIINSDQLAMVYQILLEGNEGISLATGSEADRKLVLHTVMEDL